MLVKPSRTRVGMSPLRRLSATALLTFALAWSGCFGSSPKLEEATDDTIDTATRRLHSVAEILPFVAATKDGTALRGHVYLPDGEGPFGVILNYSPYWNSIDGHSESQTKVVDGRTTMTDIFQPLLEAGFAVALVNLRGTGESEGCNPWLDPAADGSDAYDVIQSLAAEAWSNGNVGMVGISWHGYSQYAALVEKPPALKAVAPASAILDTWNLFTRHGPSINTQFGPMATTYAAFYALTGVGVYGDMPASRLTCPEHVEQLQAFNQLTVDGDKSAFFEGRDFHEIIADTEIPMLVTNGLTRFGEGHILQIDGLWDLLPEERRLLIGQWPHSYPDDDREAAYEEMLVAWFDHYLRGGPKLVETGVVEYQDDEEDWHASTEWPPPSTTTRLFLSAGTLEAEKDDVRVSRSLFQSSYVDPRPDDCPQPTKVLYVSPPLAQDVLVAGNFRANVTVTSTEPNGNFGLFLWHENDLLPCEEGAADLQDLYALREVSRALSDLRHRGTLEQGLPFPIGSPSVMSMQSHPFASQLRAGERLILGVAGGAVELAPRPEQPTYAIETGTGDGWLDLPVVEGELVFRAD